MPTAKTPKNDAIKLLTADHAEVKKLFKQYEQLATEEADAGERQIHRPDEYRAVRLFERVVETRIVPQAGADPHHADAFVVGHALALANAAANGAWAGSSASLASASG